MSRLRFVSPAERFDDQARARLSLDLLAANGIMDEYPIMHHMCILETVKTYAGTEQIHKLVIGERVTGIAAYK